MPRHSTWTAKDIAELCEYAREGLSAKQIGDKIGRTRNAVIGKLHRLGMGTKITIKTHEPVKEKAEVFEIGQIPLAEIQLNQCRYMGGGYDDKLCCGKPIHAWSMCEEHYGICIENPKSKKETDKKLDEHRAKTQDWENTIAI